MGDLSLKVGLHGLKTPITGLDWTGPDRSLMTISYLFTDPHWPDHDMYLKPIPAARVANRHHLFVAK